MKRWSRWNLFAVLTKAPGRPGRTPRAGGARTQDRGGEKATGAVGPGRQAPLVGCGVLGRVLLVPVVASQEEHAAGRRAPSTSKHVRAGVGQEDTLTSEREGG